MKSKPARAETGTFATLRALHALIGEALDEVERVFDDHAKQGAADLEGSLEYPSLDVPYYATAAHTRTEEAAERAAADPRAVVSAARIVAACGQLSATVHRPFFSLVEGVMSEHLAACLRFLEASNTVEILRDAGEEGLSVDEIAHRIGGLLPGVVAHREGGSFDDEMQVNAGNLSHILRLLATHHWIREVRPDVFANNRLSALVDSGKTLNELRDSPAAKYEGTDGVACMMAMLTDEFFKSMAYMTDSLLPKKERAVSLRSLCGNRDATMRLPVQRATPFNLALRTELGYFKWLELPENKARLSEFGRAMTGSQLWEVADNIITAFPWSDLPKDAVVIDVGGGIGSTSLVLAKAFPHLRFIVQDRQHVVDIAPSVWGPSHAEPLARITFRAHDFFTPQPPTVDLPGFPSVASPSVFLIRGCTHNWPDDQTRKMLWLLRQAASPSTKLLLVDLVLPLACHEEMGISGVERSLAPEGSPLLANLGMASANGYLLDISMMVMLDGKERTLRELSALALSAGWKVSKMKRYPGTLWAYTTAEPAAMH